MKSEEKKDIKIFMLQLTVLLIGSLLICAMI